MVLDVGGLLFCNLLFFAAGAGFVRLLGGWRTLPGLARSVGVCYLAGVVAFGVTLQLLLVLGAPFNRWLVIVVSVALALSGLLARSPADPPALTVRVPRYLLPAVVVVIAAVVLMAVDLWFQPLGVWDAWAQWTAKARALIIFGGLTSDVLSSAPYHPWNNDYPLLLPAVEAADFSFMQSVNTRAIHIQFWLIYAGFLLALLQLLRGRVREVLVWPFVLGVALAPSVHVQTASAIADVPVAVFFALAGVFAWRWLVDADGVAVRLFALFAAGTLATKFEGRIMIGALSATMIFLVVVAKRPQLRATIIAVGASLVGLVPMMLWTSHYGVVGAFSTSISDRVEVGLVSKFGRVPVILEQLIVNVFDPARWFLFGILIVVSLVLGLAVLKLSVEPWFVVGTLALATLGLVLAYVASPFDVDVHLDLSARRVVTGPTLFAIALAPLLLESVLQAREQRLAVSQYPLHS
jgi:hypothetical protein